MHYFTPTYRNINDEEESNNMYQKEFLKAFEIDTYDFNVIDKKMKSIYACVEKEPVIREYLEKYRGQYFTNNIEFILFQMFSYHHFSDFYPILKKSYNFTSVES